MEKRWHFQDVTGHQYIIGLYHNTSSGHFMLYVNTTISIIDFNILESKSYSIFVGNELFKVSIEKKDNDIFDYDLETISPRLQQKRWEKIRDSLVLWLIIFIGMVGIMLLIMFLLD